MNTRILLYALLFAQPLSAQTSTETISKELSFEKRSSANALMIANLFGSVKVTAYDGDKIAVEVKKSVFAKTDARLEKGKAEVQLGIIDRADTLILYVRDGCHEFTRGGLHKRSWQRWGYDTNQDNCHLTYDYKMDFTVKVPATLNVDIATINGGSLLVENVAGTVRARNVNGSIRLENLKGGADAHTVNGDVDVVYAQNPSRDCRFYSLNGDINAVFQPGLSASVAFESFNGDFYTNINRLENLPVTVDKSGEGQEGVKYRISGNRYQVGTGGVLLDFETFNGNLYLKEKTK